nr:hydrogen peroxide-inducible genes activator [Sphingomonas bacterium]
MSSYPSVRQLSYLVALHEHGHFGRAAAACFVTQSTLSVGLAELERLLGTLLVERSKRSVRFTAMGEEVVARARHVILATEDLCTVAQGAREPLVGSIRLAAIPTIAPYLLPRVLAGVEAAWPQLRLMVREMLTSPACEALHRGDGDCVLLALPAECGDVEAFEVAIDPLVLASPATEGEVGTAVAFDRIDPERLLLLEDGHCLRDHALATCQAGGSAGDAALVASTLETLVRLVDAGRGLTLLPQMAVDAGILTGFRVRSSAITGGSAERRVALVWRRGHSRQDEFRLLGRTIRDAVGGDGAAIRPGQAVA